MSARMDKKKVMAVLDRAYYGVPDSRGDLAEAILQASYAVADVYAQRDALLAAVKACDTAVRATGGSGGRSYSFAELHDLRDEATRLWAAAVAIAEAKP